MSNKVSPQPPFSGIWTEFVATVEVLVRLAPPAERCVLKEPVKALGGRSGNPDGDPRDVARGMVDILRTLLPEPEALELVANLAEQARSSGDPVARVALGLATLKHEA